MKELKLCDKMSYWLSRFDTKNLKSILSDTISLSEKNKANNGAHMVSKHKNLNEFNEWINKKENHLSELCHHAFSVCKGITKKEWESIESTFWINIVKSKNPVQRGKVDGRDDLVWHNHTEINKKYGENPPDYTFVFYLQMPNNLKNDDGMIYLRGSKGEVVSLLPKVGDLLILDGNCWHSPQTALNSDMDRIVLAGNFYFKPNLKKMKTLL